MLRPFGSSPTANQTPVLVHTIQILLEIANQFEREQSIIFFQKQQILCYSKISTKLIHSYLHENEIRKKLKQGINIFTIACHQNKHVKIAYVPKIITTI